MKKFVRGIGYSEGAQAVFVDMKAAKENQRAGKTFTEVPQPDCNEKHIPWARWGTNNLLPMEMAHDIETTGILSGILEGKARFAACNGVLPALVHYEKNGQMVIDKIVMDPEIQDFLEDNNHFFHTHAWMKDQCAFGQTAVRFMLNGKRDKIVAFQRDDVTEMRYAKMDGNGRIPHVYYSACWDKVGNNVNDERIIKVPLLNWNNPLADLKKRVEKSKDVEFVMTSRQSGWGRKYYPPALWYAAYLWVKIAQGVPEMKAAMFENNFRPKYVVVINEKYWDGVFSGEKDENGKLWDDYTAAEIEQKKNKEYDNIEKFLIGNKNAYKSIFCSGYYDGNGKLIADIEIKAIEDTTKNGEFLPDSAAANSEIAFAMLFNPGIIGANMPSGPYTNSQGGSNVRESTLIQVIIHELERQNVRRKFNLISRFNGWSDKYNSGDQRLEWFIPATIPTTLDTGSNTKPMVTGVSPQNDPSNAN
ncbi:MAG: hypothetical protein ACTHMC_05265 [Pseudobacter sp.]|uniref:hypothetical protein n=1 Tax=Pseudobacter sp. TaxID=2045420 RepID=UPI003F7F8CC8